MHDHGVLTHIVSFLGSNDRRVVAAASPILASACVPQQQSFLGCVGTIGIGCDRQVGVALRSLAPVVLEALRDSLDGAEDACFAVEGLITCGSLSMPEDEENLRFVAACALELLLVRASVPAASLVAALARAGAKPMLLELGACAVLAETLRRAVEHGQRQLLLGSLHAVFDVAASDDSGVCREATQDECMLERCMQLLVTGLGLATPPLLRTCLAALVDNASSEPPT